MRANRFAYGDHYSMTRTFIVPQRGDRQAEHAFERFLKQLDPDELRSLMEDEYEELTP